MLNKNRKILIFLAAFVLGWLWSFGVVRAATAYSLKLTSSLTLSEGSAKGSIKQVFSVAGADKTNLPATAQINVIGRQPAGLKAAGPDGAKLTAQYDQAAHTIEISIPQERRAAAGAWSFSLSYQAELLSDFGATRATQIPAMATNLDITSQTTTVAADLNLGFATVRSVAPSKTAIGVGQQILTFTSPGPQDKSLLVVFGEQSFVDAKFSTTLKNNSWWWNEVGLTLPPDTNQQRVILESIQPSPSRVRLDRDGNIVAFYRIGPFGSRKVEVTARLTVDNPTYQLDSATAVDTTDQSLKERYTEATDAWQPLGLELELADDATSADVAKAVFDGVVARAAEQATADEGFSLVPRASALKISDWLVGELRARGLPAREVLGLIMSDGDSLSAEPRQHAWVEAYLSGVGWVTLDPYFGLSSGQYGGADPLRVGLALWGLEDDRPPVDLSLASLEFQEEAPSLPESDGQLEVSAKKYMVLPFISVFNQSVKLAAGGIVDDVSLATQRGQLVLGSLAPYQQATQRGLVFGGASYSAETVTAQVGGDEESRVEAISQTSYLVIITEGLLILLVLVWRWRRQRPARQPKSRIKPSKEALTLHDEVEGGSIEEENLVKTADALAADAEPAPAGFAKEPNESDPSRPPELIQ